LADKATKSVGYFEEKSFLLAVANFVGLLSKVDHNPSILDKEQSIKHQKWTLLCSLVVYFQSGRDFLLIFHPRLSVFLCDTIKLIASCQAISFP
jgi:hypothetical protein